VKLIYKPPIVKSMIISAVVVQLMP